MPTKILSVDDSKTIRMIVKRTFSPYDATVFGAGNGEEGLAAAAAEKPDLIILDITMPVMDGVTMLIKLKESPELKGIPVIMLTAESGRENVAYIAKLGVLPDWDSGNAGIRSHMQRAFACAALLRCTNHNEGDSINCILAPLLESCIELGPDYLEALKQFVVSEITKLCTPQLRRESSSEKFYEDDDKVIAYSFYSVAYCIILHIFYLNNKKSRNIDVLKNSLIFSIQCGNYTSIMQHQAVENWWLYGASFQDMSYDIWHKLAQTHLFDQIEKFPPSLHDTIRFLGDKLVTAS